VFRLAYGDVEKLQTVTDHRIRHDRPIQSRSRSFHAEQVTATIHITDLVDSIVFINLLIFSCLLTCTVSSPFQNPVRRQFPERFGEVF
jgi:hypothetical protein